MGPTHVFEYALSKSPTTAATNTTMMKIVTMAVAAMTATTMTTANDGGPRRRLNMGQKQTLFPKHPKPRLY